MLYLRPSYYGRLGWTLIVKTNLFIGGFHFYYARNPNAAATHSEIAMKAARIIAPCAQPPMSG